jgi:hypothetical protein
MNIKEKDIKLLWGRAANRCSFPDCRVKLCQDNKTATNSFPIGEQAHIVGKEEGSARSGSILSVNERDSYHNLILLCPNHHTLVDKNPDDYPIEKLHMFKSQHEYWVESTLSESHDVNAKANDIIYAHLIDFTAEGCSFSIWEEWISALFSTSHTITEDTYYNALKYTLKMHTAVWPGKLPELESSMKFFAETMNIMLNFYMKKAERHETEEGRFVEDRSYKRQWHSEERFRELHNIHERWERYLEDLIVEVVKAANWLAELVRRDINPLFMATDGRFSLIWGPDDNLSFHTIAPEYSTDEKRQLIDSYEERCIIFKNKADSIDV